MKKKFIIIGSLIVLLVFGFLYSQKSNLIADDKDKKDCSSKCTEKTSSATNKTDCTQKNTSSASTMTDDKDGYAVYEFVTDKISCDGCKKGMSEKLMGGAGIKEVNYGETCKVSHMTNVKVYYSAADTTPEVIAASVKEKGLSCDKSK
ncbi:MAG: hypothetical protein ABI840_03075, partial [bacterium]